MLRNFEFGTPSYEHALPPRTAPISAIVELLQVLEAQRNLPSGEDVVAAAEGSNVLKRASC